MPGPLSEYRIIDLTSNVSGPLATMILADQGADVIKVEAPKGGDSTRGGGNRRAGFTASFLNNNRNKRSIVLDLKKPAAVDALLRLAAGADVFAQNFRPGVAERLGVGEEAVRAVSPKIVYVSISGFGEKGPYALKPAYDPVIQGFSGLATVQAGSDEARPRLLRTILPDKLTAITASQAITAALLARERTGAGQHVRLSMLEAVLTFMWASDMGDQTFVGDEPPRQTSASAHDLIYDTADGYITVAALTDRQWAGLARAVEHLEWIDDERFKTPALRQKNIDARLDVTQQALMTRSTAEWLERLTAAQVPCGPVLTRNEVIRHPQVEALGLVVETEHDKAGRLWQARAAARFSRTPTEIRRGAPALGEQTVEILTELGYSPGEIEALVTEGAAGIAKGAGR
ncbi:MAG: CoA transferase [Alphaproteobacteria bacterium]|nr:CoA transferase [Alphaproteobacteria bacterium]